VFFFGFVVVRGGSEGTGGKGPLRGRVLSFESLVLSCLRDGGPG
jgi:hypothetical protein